MMKLAILLVVGVIARQVHGDEPEAIVGGNMATVGQFPHQASLQVSKRHICGCTIIDPKHIVTAAHCVANKRQYKDMTVVTGTTMAEKDGERHDIESICVHPDYTGQKRTGWKDDIAVITLKVPMEFNNVQKPIPLASKEYATGEWRGVTSGWGLTNAISSKASPNLLWIEVNVLSQEKCLAAYPKRLLLPNPYTNEKQMCTLEGRGKGACNGDSGGPLVINGELCGVTSWVVRCARGVPDVFTNVYHYREFIEKCIAM